MEKDPLVNRFISVPRDKTSLNCAVFIAGLIEAVLVGTGFVSWVHAFLRYCFNQHFFKPAKVTAHWHKGTTYMLKFDDEVLLREKQME